MIAERDAPSDPGKGRASEPCLRCGRPSSRGGRRIGGRRVCRACAYHFRDPEPCPICMTLSKRLVYSKAYGRPACETCRNRLTHRTCTRCRRYRVLGGWNDDGRPLCSACADDNPAHHDCPSCGTRLPGRGNGRCSACLVRDQFARRVALEAGTFATDRGEALFIAYCSWLDARGLSPALVRRLGRHAATLRAIEMIFDPLGCTSQINILDCLGMQGVRRAETFISFLIATDRLVWDTALAEDWTERRRIDEIVDRAHNAGHGALVDDYRSYLEAAAGQRTLQTLRQYLRTALSFLEAAQRAHPDTMLSYALPDGEFGRFLQANGGAAANLAPFRSYLVARGLTPPDLAPPNKNTISKRDRKLVERVSVMRRRLTSSRHDGERRALAASLIADLFAIPRSSVLKLRQDAVVRTTSGLVTLVVDSRHYDLPYWLGETIIAVKPTDGHWLFPGRGGGRPLSAAAVQHHVKASRSAK